MEKADETTPGEGLAKTDSQQWQEKVFRNRIFRLEKSHCSKRGIPREIEVVVGSQTMALQSLIQLPLTRFRPVL